MGQRHGQADAIIGRFDNDDNVELFRENGIIALAQDYKSRFSNIPNITGDYRKTGRMAAEFFLSKRLSELRILRLSRYGMVTRTLRGFL